MNRETLIGGNPWSVALRLILLSVVVGIVLSALGITPDNIIERLNIIIRRLYDMGFGAVEWAFRYFLLGAVVVVPIWLVARAINVMRAKDGDGTKS